ncbi:MAG: DUF2059 domain-containing protein [Hyphomicrobiaceae bacterium]
MSKNLIGLSIASLICSILVSTQPVDAQDPAPNLAVEAKQDVRRALAAEISKLMDYPAAVSAWKSSLGAAQNFSGCGCAAPKHMQEKFNAAWKNAVADGFDVDEVVAVLEDTTAQTMTLDELKQAINFRKSPLGQKVLLAEQTSRKASAEADPANTRARMTSAQKELDAKPLRKAQLKKLLELSGGMRGTSDVLINISIGTALGASTIAQPNQPRISDDEIVSMVEATRPMVEKSVAATLLPHYANLYASLSDAELKALNKQMSRPEARKFTSMTLAAFNHAMRAQALKMGKHFAGELQAEKI